LSSDVPAGGIACTHVQHVLLVETAPVPVSEQSVLNGAYNQQLENMLRVREHNDAPVFAREGGWERELGGRDARHVLLC